MKLKSWLRNLILSAVFLALCYVLPLLTGQIPSLGQALCPMHIPVLLCGFLCGWQWGLGVGLLAPLSRSFLFTMPPLFPTALCMSFELAVYGLLAGLLYRRFPKKPLYVYPALLLSMLGGRVVWGIARFFCAGLDPSKFGISAFVAGAVSGSIPGIALQIVLIPVIVIALDRAKLIRR